MLEARRDRDSMPRQQGELRRAIGKPFKGGEAMGNRKLPDRIHSRVKVERREAEAGVANLGDAQTDLIPDS